MVIVSVGAWGSSGPCNSFEDRVLAFSIAVKGYNKPEKLAVVFARQAGSTSAVMIEWCVSGS